MILMIEGTYDLVMISEIFSALTTRMSNFLSYEFKERRASANWDVERLFPFTAHLSRPF
jgi:hypothetical protein